MVTYFMYFSLFYFLFSGCIIYPSTEFVSAGLTIQNIFAKLLGNENTDFIRYHIGRTVLTLIIHSLLPLGYPIGLRCFASINVIMLIKSGSMFWVLYIIGSIILPIVVLIKVLRWSSNNWANHPLAKDIQTLNNCLNTNGQEYSWKHTATKINLEYRSVNKVTINTSSIIRTIVLDNWIIKITPYKLYLAHQDHCVLIVHKTDTHLMSPVTRDEVQYVNIEVKGTNLGGMNFNIRLNSLEFEDLQNKVRRPIVILENVVFHRTLLDRFIDTFKEHVAQNAIYETSQELEQCIGCMQMEANVKLNQQCAGNMIFINGRQTGCYRCDCRPLWCIDCMAKWFASRQDKNLPETWLSSKCPCPVCRATFCILDVCQVQKVNASD